MEELKVGRWGKLRERPKGIKVGKEGRIGSRGVGQWERGREGGKEGRAEGGGGKGEEGGREGRKKGFLSAP